MNSIEINETNELVKKTELPETPFTIVEIDGKYFGAMGQYRLTEIWDEYETAQAELMMMSWNNILKVVMVVLDLTQKNNSTNEK
jgi:hypothetical protein